MGHFGAHPGRPLPMLDPSPGRKGAARAVVSSSLADLWLPHLHLEATMGMELTLQAGSYSRQTALSAGDSNHSPVRIPQDRGWGD